MYLVMCIYLKLHKNPIYARIPDFMFADHVQDQDQHAEVYAHIGVKIRNRDVHKLKM